MFAHLRSNLLLLVLTVILCCIVYPAILLLVGQTVFPDKAEGSLIYDKSGKAIGSRLIAQPFTGEEYFQSRPSAVLYNAAGSGASNWGANNPNLRKRVVGMLGRVLKYRDGRPVGPVIVVWVKDKLRRDRTLLTRWVDNDPYLAERWGGPNAEFLTAWEKAHPAVVDAWRSANADAPITPTILAGLFFTSYANNTTADWPETNGTDLQIAFFDSWWQAHSEADVQPVPADMVMASGCGLDPHITLKSALYQLDRVAAKWTTADRDLVETKQEVEKLLRENAEAPLGGLVGVDLVNVLEVNLALKNRFGS